MKILKGKLWDACDVETGRKICDCIVGNFINIIDLKEIVLDLKKTLSEQTNEQFKYLGIDFIFDSITDAFPFIKKEKGDSMTEEKSFRISVGLSTIVKATTTEEAEGKFWKGIEESEVTLKDMLTENKRIKELGDTMEEVVETIAEEEQKETVEESTEETKEEAVVEEPTIDDAVEEPAEEEDIEAEEEKEEVKKEEE